MDALIAEITNGSPDAADAIRIAMRLGAALIVGSIIGWQREASGKAAGLRTHMLVALGTTLFVASAAQAGMEVSSDAMSRVLQGIATGIGFIGAGAILKLPAEKEIVGLTTAAGLWMTAAAAVAAGLGRYGEALTGAVIAWIVLAAFARLERHIPRR
jgi:putative Mg2+ transporter-C (MgtC) family protein